MESGVALRERVEIRAFAVSPRLALAGIVGLSAVVRFLLALRRPTIVYLPDEYTYSALARGIAATGTPSIRGVGVHFPALLEPLLAAPFWLAGDPDLAYRLTQAEHAVFMSLAAIPVYLLARRLSIGAGFSLAVAALAVVGPNLLYVSFLVSEPVAYPLVLAAVYASVLALETGTRRAQLAAIGLICIASFARIQYALLAPIVVVAALLVERGSVRRAAAKSGLVAGTFAILLLAGAAVGPGRVIGVYHGLLAHHTSIGGLARQVGMHAVLLPFSAGFVLVPGALVGLCRGLWRPRSTAENAFAWVTVLLGACLAGEAAYVGAAVSGNYGERYLICLFPLLPIAFALYARRDGGSTRTLVVAAVLAVVAMRVGLFDYTDKSSDSTFLYATMRIFAAVGRTDGALLLSLAAALLAVIAAFVALRPARYGAAALAIALLTQSAIAAAATSWDLGGTRFSRTAVLPADVRWVDDAHVGPVTFLQPPWSDRGAALQQLFWNTSLRSVVLLPGAKSLDSYANPRATVARDGTIEGANGAVRGSVLVDTGHTWVTFADARLVHSFRGHHTTSFQLWRPTGSTLRLAGEAYGISADGWLDTDGVLTVWPSARPRRLVLRISLPASADADTIHLETSAGEARDVLVQPARGKSIVLEVPASSRPWRLRWTCDRFTVLPDGQRVSFRVVAPRVVGR
jgi:hypothetical protein